MFFNGEFSRIIYHIPKRLSPQHGSRNTTDTSFYYSGLSADSSRPFRRSETGSLKHGCNLNTPPDAYTLAQTPEQHLNESIHPEFKLSWLPHSTLNVTCLVQRRDENNCILSGPLKQQAIKPFQKYLCVYWKIFFSFCTLELPWQRPSLWALTKEMATMGIMFYITLMPNHVRLWRNYHFSETTAWSGSQNIMMLLMYDSSLKVRVCQWTQSV